MLLFYCSKLESKEYVNYSNGGLRLKFKVSALLLGVKIQGV